MVFPQNDSPRIESGPQLNAPAKNMKKLLKNIPQWLVKLNNTRVMPLRKTDKVVPMRGALEKNLEKKKKKKKKKKSKNFT